MAALSLRPWARDSAVPENAPLKEVLARVAAERGHFRDITEASLQEELAAQGTIESSDSEDEEEEEDDTDKAVKKPTTREELFLARNELLDHIGKAHNDVMLALDYVSLLQSKDAPQQANTTMSVALKQMAPSGSLGTDLWQRMQPDPAREAQDELVAANVRLSTLQQSADNILAAATRLRDNVQKETRFWDQVLSITEKGWNIRRAPGSAHLLAVTYGFSESSPRFSNRGIAALSPDSDGNITLDQGIGSQPKALRVTLKQGDTILGQSNLRHTLDPFPTTENRIRNARDSLFDEELFHEMVRESRTMSSLGVRLTGSSLSLGQAFQTDSQDVDILFELAPLDAHSVYNMEAAEDNTAGSIALVARLLLSLAHRDKLAKRSQIPPPLSSREEERPTLAILRPILALLLHRSAIQEANEYAERLRRLLAEAKIKVLLKPARLDQNVFSETNTFDSLVRIMTRQWVSEAEIRLPSHDWTMSLVVETTLAHGMGPKYSVRVPSTPEQRPVRFDSIGEVRSAADASLAQGLVRALGESTKENWTFSQREAMMTNKTPGKDGRSMNVLVYIDSGADMLCVASRVKRLVWRLSQKSSEIAFGDALKEVM